jgi:hypothetical protein
MRLAGIDARSILAEADAGVVRTRAVSLSHTAWRDR